MWKSSKPIFHNCKKTVDTSVYKKTLSLYKVEATQIWENTSPPLLILFPTCQSAPSPRGKHDPGWGEVHGVRSSSSWACPQLGRHARWSGQKRPEIWVKCHIGNFVTKLHHILELLTAVWVKHTNPCPFPTSKRIFCSDIFGKTKIIIASICGKVSGATFCDTSWKISPFFCAPFQGWKLSEQYKINKKMAKYISKILFCTI